MPTRRTLLFIAVCTLGMACVVAAPAVAADASATAFVTKPSLAALIIKDQKAAHGEVGILDGDPFIDAQDWEISAVDIAVRDVSPDKAVATVNFKNIDRQSTIMLDLIKIKSDWRIANITWQRDGGKKETLRGLFRH